MLWRTILISLPLACVGVGTPAVAWGQHNEALERPLPLDMTSDMVETSARTRFHLVTRFMPDDTFDIWSFEASGVVQVIEGAGVTFGVPFGLDRPARTTGLPRRFFLGNIRLGFAGGADIRLTERWGAVGTPTFHIGGALDVYIPTRPSFSTSGIAACRTSALPCDAAVSVGATRTLDPGLYLSAAFAGRARAHVGLSVSYFAVGAEVGVTPATTLDDDKDTYLFLTWAGRIRTATPLLWLEVFVEAKGAERLVAPSTPRFDKGALFLTPGFRFFADTFSVATFVSVPLSNEVPGTIMFGVDVGGATEDSRRAERRKLDAFSSNTPCCRVSWRISRSPRTRTRRCGMRRLR